MFKPKEPPCKGCAPQTLVVTFVVHCAGAKKQDSHEQHYKNQTVLYCTQMPPTDNNMQSRSAQAMRMHADNDDNNTVIGFAPCGSTQCHNMHQAVSTQQRSCHMHVGLASAAKQTQQHHEASNTQCWLHWMLFRSMPSCTISHSGDISRSLLTCDTVCATAASTSASVVKRPRPYLKTSER